MPVKSQPVDLAFGPCPRGSTRTRWLYDEIRKAILDGRLPRRAPIPPTRTLAAQYDVSRRIVVNVFDMLSDEGYLTAVVGSGTRVSDNIPEDFLAPATTRRQTVSLRPAWATALRARPFLPVQPSLAEFPMDVWARLEARSLRHVSTRNLADADPAGDRALRIAIAAHLGASRGVRCSHDQIIVTSGTQQSLDLLARALIHPGNRVWIEDPGYTDAAEIFRLAGAQLTPIPVDEGGLRMPGPRIVPPRLVYLTPAHQFPLGVSLRLDRRLHLLHWAREHGVLLPQGRLRQRISFFRTPHSRHERA